MEANLQHLKKELEALKYHQIGHWPAKGESLGCDSFVDAQGDRVVSFNFTASDPEADEEDWSSIHGSSATEKYLASIKFPAMVTGDKSYYFADVEFKDYFLFLQKALKTA